MLCKDDAAKEHKRDLILRHHISGDKISPDRSILSSHSKERGKLVISLPFKKAQSSIGAPVVS